jgi:hypothetical protein
MDPMVLLFNINTEAFPKPTEFWTSPLYKLFQITGNLPRLRIFALAATKEKDSVIGIPPQFTG